MSLSRNFRSLWAANTVSNLADGVSFVAVPLLAASLTDDPRLVAGLAGVYALVRLLVTLPVGVWVDRLDRRSLLAAANLARGGTVVALGACVQLDVGGIAILYVAIAILGTLESATDNAATALVPSLVAPRDLDRANARISAGQLIADEFAGPPIGGLLFALAAAIPIFTMGGLWAVAGLLALSIPIAQLRTPKGAGGAPRRPSMWREALHGAKWLAQHRMVGSLALIGGLASVGYMLPFSILVLFAEDRLGADAIGYSLILAFSALGGLVGSWVASSVRRVIGYRNTIVASLLIGAGSLTALSFTTNEVVAAVLLAAYILHAVVWGICATSLRQRLTPDGLRGRVNAATRVLALVGLVVGSTLGGVLAVAELTAPIFVGGLVFLGCSAIAFVLINDSDGT